MSLYGNISMLNSAMRSFQYGLNVTANNIANASTLGYSRQVLNLEPTMPVSDGLSWLGSGVSSGSVQRVRNLFLDSRIKFELSELGRASVRQTALTELAAIFPEVTSPTSTAGLKGALSQLATDWNSLIASPTNMGIKGAIVSDLKAVADMLQSDSRKLVDLQIKLDDQIKSRITEVNSLVDQIVNLNQQIRVAKGKVPDGSAPGVLWDLREQAAQKLSRLINANFNIVSDGSMVVTFSGGPLADATHARHLVAMASKYDPGRTGVGYHDSPFGAPVDVSSKISGGELGGLLTIRDGELEKARLDLNRIAYGLLSRSNEVNRTYTAGDGTSGHDLLVGHSAADIAIDPNVFANADYVGGTRDPLAAGDLAKMQSQIGDFIQFSSMRTATTGTLSGGGPNIDPTLALNAQVFASAPTAFGANSGHMVISTDGNAKDIFWDNSQTLNEIIRNINTTGAGAFYATFDAATQKVIIVGQTPMTVYDVSANLADVLMLSSVVTSSAPINNYPVPGSFSVQVDPFVSMNAGQNVLELFTTPSANGGTILIDGNPITWNAFDDIGVTLFLAIQAATAPPAQVSLFFDALTQTISLERNGDPAGANAGVHSYPGSSMTAVQVVDQSGNLSRVLNLDTNTNASKILDEMLSTLGARMDAEGVLALQAQALVDQSQQLQDNMSAVDLNAELAQARLYQRSFEASVRLQAILDEILNVLINHTGSQSSAATAV